MFLDGFATGNRALGLGAEHAQDAVGIAHRGDFGVGHHQRFVGEVHGHQRAALDARGRVADDEVKAHFAQILEDLLDAILGQGFLVAGLRGGQHEQVVALLILDQRLIQVGFALDHIDQVIDHPALATHDQVEIAQTDVEVDDCGLVAAQSEAGSEAGTGGGLAHSTLAGGHDDDFGHVCTVP
ncbi:hypothetical protein D3C78_1224140 [compost metagenome]